jgi:hypothetical protein
MASRQDYGVARVWMVSAKRCCVPRTFVRGCAAGCAERLCLSGSRLSHLEATPPEILRCSLGGAKSPDRKARGLPHIRRQSRFTWLAQVARPSGPPILPSLTVGLLTRVLAAQPERTLAHLKIDPDKSLKGLPVNEFSLVRGVKICLERFRRS